MPDPSLVLTVLPIAGEPVKEDLPLIVQRRLLVLEEGERVFIWHPISR